MPPLTVKARVRSGRIVVDAETALPEGTELDLVVADHERAGRGLDETERRYRLLFENMGEGFALAEMIWDDAGNPKDWRYLEVNRAWEQTGVPVAGAVGKTVREINPRVEPYWIETYARVVQTGEPVAFEAWADGLGKWFDTVAFKHSDNRFGLLFRDVTARKDEEARTRASEEKYRALFEQMDEAYAVVEVIADDGGRWNDFLFVEVNPAFVRHTGMPHPVGRTAKQLLGTPNPRWVELYARAAETGESIRVEERELTLGRIFDLNIFRLGGEGSRRVAVLFTDITARKRAEEALRISEARHAFLLKLSDATRALSDPLEIQSVVAGMLTEHLGVDRVMYAEMVEGEKVIIHRDHVTSGPSMVGVYPWNKMMGEQRLRDFAAGKAFVVEDVEDDSRLGPEGAALRRMNMRATIGWALKKNGKWIASLGVYSATPRHWTEEEVLLVRDAAERTAAEIQRAHSEAALREREERYRSLFTSIDEGFCVVEVLHDDAGAPHDLLYLETNPAFARQSGVEIPMAGRTYRELTGRAPQPEWLELCLGVLRTGESVHADWWLTTTERWINISVSRVGPAGSKRAACVFKDVTERRLAAERMRESDARKTFLVELNDALAPLHDPIAIEAEACRMLGEHLGVDRAYYVQVDERAGIARVERDWVSPLQNGAPSLAGTHRVADFGWSVAILRRGECHVVADTQTSPIVPEAERPASRALGIIACMGTPLIKGGELVGALCVTVNRPRVWSDAEVALLREVGERIWSAVERARAEAALRESEANYRSLFESMDEGYALCAIVRDAEGRPIDHRFEALNPAFEAVFGVRSEEAIGKLRSEVLPNAPPDAFAQFARVVEHGELVAFDTYYAAVDRWFHVRAYPRGGDRFAVLFEDISDRKRAEADLREADRQKDAFIATLSHELRNPVAAIASAGALLAAPVTAGERPRAQATEAAQVVLRQTKVVTRLLDDLLDRSRIALGRFELDKERVLVTSIIDLALEATRPLLDAARQRVAVKVTPETLAVEADATRLSQVIGNLVTNASKYSEPEQPIAIEAFAARDDAGDRVEIRVVDRGIGIEPGKVERLFDMFAQGDDEKDRARSGMGVGLALARQILELHGGAIRGESDGLGKGSCFRVLLPSLSSDPAAAPQTAQTEAPRTALRVLVVEDDRDLLAMFTSVLQLLGYDAHGARGGRAGLTEAERLRPDVLVVDLGMPDVDGLEVARQLRATAWCADALLIALTGWGRPDDATRAREAGFDVHLTKPLDPEKARATIDAAWKRKRGASA